MMNVTNVIMKFTFTHFNELYEEALSILLHLIMFTFNSFCLHD